MNATNTATHEHHILMNVLDEQELRVAVLRNGRLESLLHERLSSTLQLGNIYKAKVCNIEPSLDAAFVDLGGDKNGFIHIDDIKHDRGDRARIEDVLSPGQELVVQITKESIKDKGPCVTTYLSIPGRYLVMMADTGGKHGISKKIADNAVRRRLKQVVAGFHAPEGFGFIVRTAGADRLDEELELDYRYLKHAWDAISQRLTATKAPACLYQEAGIVVRCLRDLVTADTTSVLIDAEEMHEEAHAFAQIFMPELASRIKRHQEAIPLFTAYGVEERLATVLDRKVELPSGGNIVIEQTEALVSIDVNSAKNRSADNVEQTALLTNLEAVQTLAEQLRLRDLGGLIIIDFIDMEDREHGRLVQLALRTFLLRDPAKTHVAQLSRFGLVEMTRQRRRPSHRLVAAAECPYCAGTGAMKTIETIAIESMRAIRAELNRQPVSRVEIIAPTEVAIGVLNARAAEIAELESEYGCRIQISGDSLMRLRSFRVQATPKKRRSRGRRRSNDDQISEPVRPSLLAPFLEQQSEIATKARELMERRPRDLERELYTELDQITTPSQPNKPSAPTTVSPNQPAAIPRAPQLWEEAAGLRSLLFSQPSPQRIGPELASRSSVAKKLPLRGKR